MDPTHTVPVRLERERVTVAEVLFIWWYVFRFPTTFYFYYSLHFNPNIVTFCSFTFSKLYFVSMHLRGNSETSG